MQRKYNINANYVYCDYSQHASKCAEPRIIRFPFVFSYLNDKFQSVFLMLMGKKNKKKKNLKWLWMLLTNPTKLSISYFNGNACSEGFAVL